MKSNSLTILIDRFPNKPWSYDILSGNPNITWETVQANPDKPWNYNLLSGNPSITWEIVKANPDKPWNYEDLSENPNITWEIVQANPDKPWSYLFLSRNPNITWEIVRDNPDKPWYYACLSANPNITWEIIIANLDKRWDPVNLLYNPNTTWEIVKSIYFNSFAHLGPDLKSNAVSYIELPSKCFADGSEQKLIALLNSSDLINKFNSSDLINKFRCTSDCCADFPHDVVFFCYNPNITWEVIQQLESYFRDKVPHWYPLSMNSNITLDIIQSNPKIHWDYSGVCENPNVTWEMSKNFKELVDYYYMYISSNPNITWEIVAENIDEQWNWDNLSNNKFLCNKDSYAYKMNKKNRVEYLDIMLVHLHKVLAEIVIHYLLFVI